VRIAGRAAQHVRRGARGIVWRLPDNAHFVVPLSLALALGTASFRCATAAEQGETSSQAAAAVTAHDTPAGTAEGARIGPTLALLDEKHVGGWKQSPFDEEGSAKFEDGQYVIGAGRPMSGITWQREFPTSNYEISLQAQRAEGGDFFCGLTFPVGNDFCSLIVGGWGGGLVGLSSLDGHDASENETTVFDQFENGRWYEIRLLVSDLEIKAWIDGRRYLRVKRAEHDFSIRFELKQSRPFGLATYRTTARIKDLQLHRLKPPVMHPGTMHAELDVAYAGTTHHRQRLDLLMPANRKSRWPLPVIVAVHGGGWQGGDKRQMLSVLKPFVETGRYAGVAVGYRLSQDAQWPAQFEDCQAAIGWVRDNAERFELDPDQIGVLGKSAGGHLVAMLGMAGNEQESGADLSDANDLSAANGANNPSSRVTCVVNYYGPSDLLTMGDDPGEIDHNGPNSPEAQLLGGAILEHRDAALSASPTHYATSDDAPMLLIHGDLDPLVPYQQSVLLQQRLRAVGVAASLVTIAGGGHGGFDGPVLQSVITSFFDKHLRGAKTEIEDQILQPGQKK